MSSDRFDIYAGADADVVSYMQKKKILGVTSRHVIFCR